METSYLLIYLLVLRVPLARADTYSVQITTQRHINVVDGRFLSFTIDPKYLFSSSDEYNSKECICMASSLTPAYLRIAGPSTTHMTFHNTTISISNHDPDTNHGTSDLRKTNLGKNNFRRFNLDRSDFGKSDLELDTSDLDLEKSDLGTSDFEITVLDKPEKVSLSHKLAVTHWQWKKFVHWSKLTGFDLVFALNDEERTSMGMWDPNMALKILTVAEKARIGDIYWELGYECKNQSIEEYLNDLETLRVIIETFPPGRTGEWRVVGGDVTGCLQAESKSDFKDYVTLSNDMMDALLLNGNSSSHELERMSENDRLKLLRMLSHSKTPLWLTEATPARYNELERAADWLASLGYSAKNGFSVHYRELMEAEMYEPTLSFYMALLFKNLVGEKVLDLQMDPEQAILFAHCTSLRHKPVPGAVTFFGVNMDDEPARFSLKLAKREDGGDIMQFILGQDRNGNIVVNGRAMINEGDIRPIVKRVRPYRTLLINLPSKSFGFWVLANTKVEACQGAAENDVNKIQTEVEIINNGGGKTKRSLPNDFDDYINTADISYDYDDKDNKELLDDALKNRINNINKDLNNIRQTFQSNERRKRQNDETIVKKKLRRPRNKSQYTEAKPKRLLDLLKFPRRNITRRFRNIGDKLRLGKGSRRHSRNLKVKPLVNIKQETDKLEATGAPEATNVDKLVRKRRSIIENDESIENEVDLDVKAKSKLWKVLKDIQKHLQDTSSEKENVNSNEGILLKTEVSDDGASIKISDSDTGLIKSTVVNVVNVLDDLNKNLNRVWDAITLLE